MGITFFLIIWYWNSYLTILTKGDQMLPINMLYRSKTLIKNEKILIIPSHSETIWEDTWKQNKISSVKKQKFDKTITYMKYRNNSLSK